MLKENVSLAAFNTFGLDVNARYFGVFENVESLKGLLEEVKSMRSELLILGGGSNMLLTKNWSGAVLHNQIKGIRIVETKNDYVLVKAGAGEVWHDLVVWAVGNDFAGIENLSLIPGNVGAGPMQNIGAYGVELKDVFYELEALDIETYELRTFSKEDCEFGYRESVFKRKFKGHYVITSVTLRLSLHAKINASYGAISGQLEMMGAKNPSIRDISNAVIAIRQSKLPDPAKIGNAGSFFKNPEITKGQFEKLKAEYPAIVGYDTTHGVKLAAGWLIEQCGWKGYTEGSFGVHKLQALVLVNYGGASGQQIYDLSSRIVETVKEKFGVELEREVNIV